MYPDLRYSDIDVISCGSPYNFEINGQLITYLLIDKYIN
jgi:S-adenosylmethionine/arginine decarboxylase-like enzyme